MADQAPSNPVAAGDDHPRVCFVCLSEQTLEDKRSDWVDPCECTLEAHQVCALEWVKQKEKDEKPLVCPVCKAKIHLIGPWDPVSALTEAIQQQFSKASPYILFVGTSLAVQISSQAYGTTALWLFSGKDVMLRYMFGPNMTVDVHSVQRVAWHRLRSALVLMNIAPALLIGHLLPALSSKICVPIASLYGMWHVVNDKEFVSWPPSPQLAIAVFPYIRSLYWNLWREFVFPIELNINRQLLGLPPAEERADGRRGRHRVQNPDGDGGLIGFLQGLLDALDPNEREEDAGDNDNGEGQRHEAVMEFEFRIGDDDGDRGPQLVVEHANERPDVVRPIIGVNEAGDDNVADGENDVGNNGADNADLAEAPPAVPQPADHFPLEPLVNAPQDLPPMDQDAPAAIPVVARPFDLPGEAPVPGALGPFDNPEADAPPEHDALPAFNAEQVDDDIPRARAGNRIGLGKLLNNLSNSVVSALVLPGISFAMGEALRLVLPRSWTATPAPFWGSRVRPGLFQQQWGRSLIGGCLYVVIRDALKLWTKHRKLQNVGKRYIKDVGRARRKGGKWG